MEDRRVKANRAQADLFELLVCSHICDICDINFDYLSDLKFLEKKILLVPNGDNRLKLQKNNFIKLKPTIDKIIKLEIFNKGKIIGVIWTGRSLSDNSTSDIDVKHENDKVTKLSVKSIEKSGTGTLKNIGAGKVNKLLGVDFKKEYDEMWLNLRTYLKDFKSSQREIKKRVQESSELLKWATENGKKYQLMLNKKYFKAFNNLSLEEKLNFINFITDYDDKDLYVFIVNSSGGFAYKPIDKKIEFVKEIEADDNKKTDVGYTIFINKKPAYRIQTNNTNGIGISAFCQRVFLI